MPKPKSPIKFSRKGKLSIRGYSEPSFEEHLKTYFLRQRDLRLYSDHILLIGNKKKPYEPDFVLVDEADGLNIFINIEIDEPYNGVTRCATHYKNCDDYRNKYFNDRGWIIIRFTEYQAYIQPLSCCRYICDVLKSINPTFTIPEALLSVPNINFEQLWSKAKAEKLAAENYRESYLKISFTRTDEKLILNPENLEETADEKSVEKDLAPFKQIPEIHQSRKINELNKHTRDSRIRFIRETHTYLIDENPNTIPVSTLVKMFFRDFDAEYWSERKALENNKSREEIMELWSRQGQDAANLGTQLHTDIENFFECREQVGKKEFQYFLKLYDDLLNKYYPYRTEWRIFDDVFNIAGTADMIFKKDDGNYVLYDWKRSKDIKRTNPYAMGFGPCSQLADCNFNHYSLQLNIYKNILQDYYAKSVTEMYFVQLHPDQPTYQVFQVPDLREVVEMIYENLSFC